MSTKYSVTALDRRGMGHPNYHCARRAWPSGQEVIIEVLDQDEDPMLESKDRDGTVHKYPDPVRLGRLSFAEIHHGPEGGLLMVRPIGAAPEEAEALQAKIADLQKAAAGAVARAELAERECARLKSVVAELELQLDAATSPALPPGPDLPAAPSVELDLDVPAEPVAHPAHAKHPTHEAHKRK